MQSLQITIVLIIIIMCKVKSDKNMTYLKMIKSFDPLRLLTGLRDIDNSSICGKHMTEYLNGLRNDTYWASVMFDATAKIPNGILKGNIKNFGNFDECIQVEHPEKKFTGQHCMLNINMASNSKNKDIFRLLLLQEDRNEFHRLWKIQHGICVPSTCTALEMSTAFNFLFNDTMEEDIFSVNLGEDDCWTKGPRKMEDTSWMAIGILISFGLVALFSSIFDAYQRFISKNKQNSLLVSFSLYTNSINLFKISENSEQLKALHGIRVLSMFWVVLFHTSGSVWLDGPPVNLFDSIETYKDFHHVPIVNGFISVDTFLFLSGMLVSMRFFRDIKKKGYYDAPLGFIHRYLRLTPSYAVMILIAANIFIYIGNGPIWNSVNKIQAENCQQNWWTGILYIQNFVNPSSNCLGQSWYLSADMQMHLLSPMILYPVYFWPKYANFLLGIAILSAVCANFAVAYTNRLGASPFTTNNFKHQWETDYVKFYTRASPYLIGMTIGYIISQIQAGRINIKLKKYMIVMGWTIAPWFCISSLYGIVPFSRSRRKTFEAALFLALHRVSWSLGLGWIVLTCIQGCAGPVHAFLSWDVFQPLSKLSYNVYLIHLHVQFYRLGTVRTNTYAGDLDLIYTFLGDVILSYLLAIPFSLIFEMPFNNLDKYFLEDLKLLPIPWSNKKPKNTDELNMNTFNKIEGDTNKNFQDG